MAIVRQTGRYVLAGLAGLAVSLAVTVVMHEGAGFSASIAFAMALGVVFTFHFAVNAFFVFNSGADRNIFFRYATAALLFRLLDFLLFSGLQGFVTPYHVAVIVAILITNLTKFFIFRKFVFVAGGRCSKAERML